MPTRIGQFEYQGVIYWHEYDKAGNLWLRNNDETNNPAMMEETATQRQLQYKQFPFPEAKDLRIEPFDVTLTKQVQNMIDDFLNQPRAKAEIDSDEPNPERQK